MISYHMSISVSMESLLPVEAKKAKEGPKT